MYSSKLLSLSPTIPYYFFTIRITDTMLLVFCLSALLALKSVRAGPLLDGLCIPSAYNTSSMR